MIRKDFLFLTFFALLTTFIMPLQTRAQEEADTDDEDDINTLHRPMSQKQENVHTTTYKGIVIDQATCQPVAGIQIQALGNRRYTAMTDETGKFAIKLPVHSTALYVNAPEYMTQQVALPADTITQICIRVISDRFRPMYELSNQMGARATFTSLHTTGLSIEDEISQLLGADVRCVNHSGVPGAGALMLIRGIGSLNADAQPLIVIDGVEQDMQHSRTALHSGQFLNMLANLSPDDIDRVEVLKNATAIYGARGANGVINITTKRGHSLATRIDANLSVGITMVPNLPKMMDATQYRSYVMEMLGKIDGANMQGNYRFLNDDPQGFYYHMYHNDTRWTDYAYRQALTQQYSINVQGGDDIGMYNLSVGYTDAKSTAEQSGFSRMNVRFNTDINILWNLTTKFDISISRTSNDVFDDGIPSDFTHGTVTSPTFLSMIKSPLLSPYQYNAIIGGFSSLLSEEDDLFDQLGKGYSLANPVAILKNGKDDNKNHSENTHFNTRLEPTLQLGRYLQLTETFSYSLNRLSQRYFRPYTGVPSFEIPELGTVTSMTASLFSKETHIQSDTRLQYEQLLGAHDIKVTAGFRYNYFAYDDNDLRTQYTSETNDKNPALSATSGYQQTAGVEDVWKNIQMYASANYNYAHRYYLSLALMGEASSRFGKNVSGLSLLGVKWGVFPCIQAGWELTNERWFPKWQGLNYLRLNAGYDISGNDNIPNYAARTSLSSVIYNYNAIGLKLSNIGNDEIQWETTRKLNMGLTANLANNRLSVTFDYFLHKTDNLLALKTFSNPIGGINRYWTNGGALENKGFEASLAFKPVVTRNWHVEIGASVGHYENKITSLPDGNYTTGIYGSDNILTTVGGPVGLFYGYKTSGVFSTEAEAGTAASGNGYLYMKDDAGNRHNFEAGDVHFADLYDDPTNPGLIDEHDKTIIGDPNPDIYGNIFARVNWKNLTLDIGLNYSLGNDIYNYQRSVLNSGSSFYNQQVQTVSHWRYEGQHTNQPRLNYGDSMGNNRMSDRWIEDGSYLRLKTVRLQWQIPVPATWNWLQGLTVWGEANNLFTLTRYTGCDPEVSISNEVLSQGIDIGLLPQSRTFTFGLKINL